MSADHQTAAARRRAAQRLRIVKVGGLAGVRIGDEIDPETKHAFARQFAPPTIETRVAARRPSETGSLWLAMQQLSEQDPLINLRSAEDASEIYLSLYGEVQKEIIQATRPTRSPLPCPA
jgi:ribosomal protection tetracycline resistance protein